MDIEVRDIPEKDIEEANKIFNMKNMSHRAKMIKISAMTGVCCNSRCRDKPAEKIVLFKLEGAFKVERYCEEHFVHSAFEDKKKRKRVVKKK